MQIAPDTYRDPRCQEIWRRVMALLASPSRSPAEAHDLVAEAEQTDRYLYLRVSQTLDAVLNG